MVIGVTDNMGAEHKLKQYIHWLHRGDPSVECVVLSYKLENASQLKRCHGLLLTGGGDVDPALYGGQTGHPKVHGVDRKRDDFERGLLDIALARNMPVLGVCRGLQITNVHFNGTLFEDLTDAGHPGHETKKEYEQRHEISVETTSSLAELVNNISGDVNSYHHQAADKPGQGLQVVARSHDGIPEAIERNARQTGQFFLLIQWHPERMKDFENPFSQRVLKAFLSSTIERKKE